MENLDKEGSAPEIVHAKALSISPSPAFKLILGKRRPPQVLVRAADCHPVNLHDECPSDGRFKILVFTGDITVPSQAEGVANVAARLSGFLRSYV